PPPPSPLFPYTTLFRSRHNHRHARRRQGAKRAVIVAARAQHELEFKFVGEPHGALRIKLILEWDNHRLFAADDGSERVEGVVCLDRKSTRLNSSHVAIS